MQLQLKLCWLKRQQRQLQLLVRQVVQQNQGRLQLRWQRVLLGPTVPIALQWRLWTAQGLQVQAVRLRQLLMLQPLQQVWVRQSLLKLLLMRQPQLRQ